MALELNQCIAFMNRLADELEEKRSDISEIINRFLSFGEEHLDWIESRRITAEIPDGHGGIIKVEYDTLTTEISYCKPEEWKQALKHEYYKG